MHAAWAIAMKDIRLLLRDRMGFFFAFAFPLIVAIFFGVIFSGGGKVSKIDVVLADLDGSEESKRLAKQLADDAQLHVHPVEGREHALELVRAGKSTAAIVIPDGFGDEQQGMFFSLGAEIELAVDPSRFAERGMLEGLLLKHGFLRMQRTMADRDLAQRELKLSRERLLQVEGIGPVRKLALSKLFNDLETFSSVLPDGEPEKGKEESVLGPSTAPSEDVGTGGEEDAFGSWQPVRIKFTDVTERPTTADGHAPKPPNSFSITFPQGIIWGVMGCALGFSVSLVTERSRGTLTRLRVAPIAPGQILMGKALACFLTTLAVSAFLLAIGALAFGVRPTSWPILTVAVLCTGFCFVGIMMLLAVMSPSERSGNGLGWGVLLMLSMIGGGMLPLFFMPDWMRAMSVLSPIRWAILSLEGGLWRGSGWGEIALPCVILISVGVAGIAAGGRLLKRQTSDG